MVRLEPRTKRKGVSLKLTVISNCALSAKGIQLTRLGLQGTLH